MISDQADPRIDKYMEVPTLITKASRNALRISSDFLRLNKCSLLLHVLMPKKEKTESPPYLTKFLIGHLGTSIETGRDEHGFDTTNSLDLFCIRYLTNRWQLTMSNHNGRWLYPFLEIRDRARPGWHQFILAWDKTKPLLIFIIHGRDGESVSTSDLQFWPEQLDKTVSIGATYNTEGDTYNDGTYIETQLAHLWIIPDFLNTDHPIVLKHRQLAF
jgi:hypothetical protein